jgi:flagellar hook-basal body complex protein FliE
MAEIVPPLVPPVRIVAAPRAAELSGPSRPLETGGLPTSFGDLLKDAVAAVNQAQQSAEEAAKSLAAGQSRDVAQTMIAVEKANVTFQLMLQVRNRLLEAYQEVMRIPV